MKKMVNRLANLLVRGVPPSPHSEDVDLAETIARSTPGESIAVDPQWADLPGGGRVQFEVFGSTGPFVFLGPHVYLSPMQPDGAAACQGFVDGLSDRYRVIVADWPRGFGQSTATESPPMTADNAVADILAIADAAGADQFAWWGYSFGGAAGLQLAARTDRVSALVVGGFPPLWQPFSDMLLAVHMAEDDLEAAGLAGTPGYLMNRGSIAFYTSVAGINQLDLLDKITAPRMVYHDVDDTIEMGGLVHDVSSRTRAAADLLEARGWEIRWMDTGKAHMVMSEYAKNLEVFAPFLDRVLLENAAP